VGYDIQLYLRPGLHTASAPNGQAEQGGPSHDPSTLLSISLTSKSMNTIVERHLYSRFIYDSKSESHSLEKFLRRVLQKPYLAQYLRLIVVLPYIHCSDDRWAAISSGDNEDHLQGDPLFIEKASSILELQNPHVIRPIPFNAHLHRHCPVAMLF
jgi:hypothetical protein